MPICYLIYILPIIIESIYYLKSIARRFCRGKANSRYVKGSLDKKLSVRCLNANYFRCERAARRERYFEKKTAEERERESENDRNYRKRERDPENENGEFPLTDPRVALAINQISAGLCAATRSGTRGGRKIEGKTEVDMTRFMYNCTHSISPPLTSRFRC